MKFPAWPWIFLDLLLLVTYGYMLYTGTSDHAGRLGILLLAFICGIKYDLAMIRAKLEEK